MAEPLDRDRQIEQLLRQMPAGRPPAASACVDAEQLAAWRAGSLRSEEAAAVEAHLSHCGDCQAMLAAFVESEPVPTTAVVPFWQRWSVRWLVPTAAAGAAVLVWAVATRTPADVPEPSMTMARVEQEAAAPPAELLDAPAAGESAPPPASPAVAAPASPSRQMQADEMRSREAPAQTVKATDAARTQEPPARQEVASVERALQGAQTEFPQAAARAAPAEAVVPSVPASAAPPPSPSPAPPPPPASSAAAAERRFAAVVPSQSNIAMDGIGATGAVAPHARANAASAVVFQAPPGLGRAAGESTAGAASPAAPLPVVRYRISPAGRVERSIDIGRTWSPVDLDSTVFILAGSAPARGVCWLVGRDGLVLRSTNGVAFERQMFPVSAALVGVEAQDAARATVTTADGRTFTTADGGQNWTGK